MTTLSDAQREACRRVGVESQVSAPVPPAVLDQVARVQLLADREPAVREGAA